MYRKTFWAKADKQLNVNVVKLNKISFDLKKGKKMTQNRAINQLVLVYDFKDDRIETTDFLLTRRRKLKRGKIVISTIQLSFVGLFAVFVIKKKVHCIKK